MGVPDLLNEGIAGQYPHSYYAATANPLPAFPKLEGDTRFDVCVIGAGYTGLSAALHLAQRGFKVAIVEAQRVGWGASGRNGGQVGSGQRIDQMSLETMVGEAHARQLWELAEDAKALVHTLIADHSIACDLKPGLIYADHKKRFTSHTEAYVAHLSEKYGYSDISFLDREALGNQLGTDAYFSGSLDRGAAHLHPLNFALGLGRAAKGAGVSIFEMSRVTNIQTRKTVRAETESGSVTADHLIVACNGYLGGLDMKTARRVMPINSYIVATEPLGEARARELIRNDFGVADSRFVVNYFRLSSDHRLLFGGRESYGYHIPDAAPEGVRKRMLSVFPQLADARIAYSWGGTLGITLSRLPFLARLHSNVLVASGFSGHGVALATLSGQLMAETVAGQAERFDLLSTLRTRVFPGGTALRRPLLVLAMLYFALRDRF